jgi:hypothetical protein
LATSTEFDLKKRFIGGGAFGFSMPPLYF